MRQPRAGKAICHLYAFLPDVNGGTFTTNRSAYSAFAMLIASPGAIRILLRNLNPICYSCSQECDGAGPLYVGFMAEIDF